MFFKNVSLKGMCNWTGSFSFMQRYEGWTRQPPLPPRLFIHMSDQFTYEVERLALIFISMEACRNIPIPPLQPLFFQAWLLELESGWMKSSRQQQHRMKRWRKEGLVPLTTFPFWCYEWSDNKGTGDWYTKCACANWYVHVQCAWLDM